MDFGGPEYDQHRSVEAVPPIPIALTVLEMVQCAVNPWGLERAMCTMFERVAWERS